MATTGDERPFRMLNGIDEYTRECLPIWLYRLQLGWLPGDCFLMLTTIGSKSGKPR